MAFENPIPVNIDGMNVNDLNINGGTFTAGDIVGGNITGVDMISSTTHATDIYGSNIFGSIIRSDSYIDITDPLQGETFIQPSYMRLSDSSDVEHGYISANTGFGLLINYVGASDVYIGGTYNETFIENVRFTNTPRSVDDVPLTTLGNGAKYEKRNGIVYLSGTITYAFTNTYVGVFTLPLGMRPAYGQYYSVTNNGNVRGHAYINSTSGLVSMRSLSTDSALDLSMIPPYPAAS